ncbi:hypothetical protein niasHT_032657 [Heterodera trifolii]|uniref:Uncharacterized protein n=1 Tax=Heterodera trifolii TaxID=157864 RepID=A0ABD2IXC5_9BILA
MDELVKQWGGGHDKIQPNLIRSADRCPPLHHRPPSSIIDGTGGGEFSGVVEAFLIFTRRRRLDVDWILIRSSPVPASQIQKAHCCLLQCLAISIPSL